MGKICWINGQPYLVSLPMGGRDENDHNNQWDEMINFLGEDCDDVFHWAFVQSWCQESFDSEDCDGVVRGYHSARYWYNFAASRRNVDVGFRPILTPLDSDTLKPDTSLLEDIPDGSRIALASLYIDGKVIAEPQNPTWNGDIANYVPETKITLGDRDKDPRNWLHVIKFKDLLWTDRNILTGISWDQLKEQGF